MAATGSVDMMSSSPRFNGVSSPATEVIAAIDDDTDLIDDDFLVATLVTEDECLVTTPETASPKSTQNSTPSATSSLPFQIPGMSWASQGKKYFDSSSWWASRLLYQSQSSSAQSSVDVPPSPSIIPMFPNRDPNLVERSNLLNITKLVIKELIEWSIRHERSLESDHPPLQHFFIVLEHAMRHGLKPKKGLLGPKKELWDVLQCVEKIAPEAQDITSSTRDLPTVSTVVGRSRAWLRLALMQKKLADYFKVLVEQRDGILKEFYEPMALMMSDEAVILGGLLVGLNVIDCNFCLKEEDLDSQQGVIDFSLYLRSSRSSESVTEDPEPTKLDSMLDQKNYVEELNRHLDATVTNLQSRVETLTTTNALMKEDLAISKNAVLALQEENAALKQKLQSTDSVGTNSSNKAEDTISAKLDSTSFAEKSGSQSENSSLVGSDIASSQLPSNLTVADLSKRLFEERTLRESLEEEIQLQIRKRAEMEALLKQLEKDCHNKGDTVDSLSRQLEDIKIINFDMYRKLQENEKSLKFKTELVTKLEEKTIMLTETIDRLDKQLSDADASVQAANTTAAGLEAKLTDKEVQIKNLAQELSTEKKSKTAVEQQLGAMEWQNSKLCSELTEVSPAVSELEKLRQEKVELLKKQGELERTLEDLGVVMKQYDLRLDNMKEAVSSTLRADATWADDKKVTNCEQCQVEFSLTKRKHHCRYCGGIFCKTCSDNVMQLPSASKPVRVCDKCYTVNLNRCVSN